jgi:hypothetical protein
MVWAVMARAAFFGPLAALNEIAACMGFKWRPGTPPIVGR